MLRCLSLGLTVLASLALFAVPEASRADDGGSRIVAIDVQSDALAGNLLETPATQRAVVYLPPGYDVDAQRRYPVIYLLHGIFDSHETWLVHFDIAGMLDRLIAAGRLPEMLVVIPDGGNKYGGGFYRNSSVSGNWADYVADELIGFVDERFRTVAAAEARGVIGHSMGGYGALHLAMTRPGVFSTVWAMSPCCLAATEDFGFGNDAWKRAAAAESQADIDRLVTDGDFYAIAALGIIAAFSPDPANGPVFGDFPFEIVRGEVVIDAAGYDAFIDTMPVNRVRAAREALRDLRGLALDVGLGDQFLHIPVGTLAFSERLGAERIPHLLDVYTGDHREHVGERLETLVLPWVGERLAVE